MAEGRDPFNFGWQVLRERGSSNKHSTEFSKRNKDKSIFNEARKESNTKCKERSKGRTESRIMDFR